MIERFVNEKERCQVRSSTEQCPEDVKYVVFDAEGKRIEVCDRCTLVVLDTWSRRGPITIDRWTPEDSSRNPLIIL